MRISYFIGAKNLYTQDCLILRFTNETQMEHTVKTQYNLQPTRMM